MKTIWNKETGEAREYESVDAKEVMKNSDLYTDVDPNPPMKDDTGKPIGPQNVANVENEFRREPVGDDLPAPEREGVIIRNPVTDQPRMAPAPGQQAAAVDLDAMTVAELKDYAASREIDLGDATLKADVRAKIDRANRKIGG